MPEGDRRRSCHTILHEVKKNCKGTVWVIEGDIKGFYDNVDHNILLELVEGKIQDLRIIGLLERFLKAGYMEAGESHNTYSGTPQGSILSPVLSNIYLHELDKHMEWTVEDETKGEEKRDNREYARWNGRRCAARKRGNQKFADECLKKMRQLPSKDPFDENYVRVKYYRYADDWIVAVIGDKWLAEDIKSGIRFFLKTELKLELNEDKTLITNLRDRNVRFLGYEISKTRSNTTLTKDTRGVKRRAANETIQLLVPSEVITDKLNPFMSDGKAVHHNARINMPVLDIISQYNAELRGLYNFYALATDVSTKIGKYKYYHYTSMVKTIARKEQISAKKVIDKYGIDTPLKQRPGTKKVVGVKYQTKAGEKVLTYFDQSLSKIDEPLTDVCDKLPIRRDTCQLIDRLNRNQCELCGKTGDAYDFEVHHVRKLKDLKDRYRKRGKQAPKWVLRMARMNRKTLVVCHACHSEIHSKPK